MTVFFTILFLVVYLTAGWILSAFAGGMFNRASASERIAVTLFWFPGLVLGFIGTIWDKIKK